MCKNSIFFVTIKAFKLHLTAYAQKSVAEFPIPIQISVCTGTSKKVNP